MKLRNFACALLLVASPCGAQWATLDDHRELANMKIVDIGDVRVQSELARNGIDEIRWIEFRGATTERCLEFNVLRIGFVDVVAALSLEDRSGSSYIATLRGGMGSISVDVQPVRFVECPR